MNKDKEYAIDKIWGNESANLQNEIIELWMAHGVLTKEQAEDRVRQVFCIGRDKSGKIVGVGTIYPQYNNQLENSFYYYRSFVAPDHRQAALATNLLKFTRDALNEMFVKGINTRFIGMLVEVENEHIKKFRNHGVWPNTGFVYIGKNNRGDHVRVYYFEGARIS
mgnify:CR=1 FL=1